MNIAHSLDPKLKEIIQDKQVLVLDDLGSMRNFVRFALVELGIHKIKLSKNGEDGLEHFNKLRFDLVITDCDMPVLNGLDVVKYIRKTKSKEEVPIIMLTGNTALEKVKAAIDQGVNDYIAKPFQPEKLQAKVVQQLFGVKYI